MGQLVGLVQGRLRPIVACGEVVERRGRFTVGIGSHLPCCGLTQSADIAITQWHVIITVPPEITIPKKVVIVGNISFAASLLSLASSALLYSLWPVWVSLPLPR